MENRIIIILISAFSGIIFGQVTQPGRCPNLPTIQNFDVQMCKTGFKSSCCNVQQGKDLSPWFGVEQFPEFRQIDVVCPITVFNLNINYTIRVEKTDYNTRDEHFQRMDSSATIVNPLDPGKWLIQDPGQQFPYPFWIIDTDYRRFAVAWTCIDLFNGNHLQSVYILSRIRQGLPQYIRYLIYRYLQAFGIDTRYFQSNDQMTCLMGAQNTTVPGQPTPLMTSGRTQSTRSF